MVIACTEPYSMMIKCKPFEGKYFNSALLFKNTDRSLIGQSAMYIRVRKTVQFVDWCPTSFKLGLSPDAPKFT